MYDFGQRRPLVSQSRSINSFCSTHINMKTNRISGSIMLIALAFAALAGIVAAFSTANAQGIPVPTCSMYATSSSGAGQPVTLSWNSTNATSAFLTPPGGGVAVNGSQIVYPTVTTIYTLAVHSSQGYSANCQTTVYVGTTSGTPSCSISASSNNTYPGQSVTLSWNSSNATSANLTNVGPVSTSDSQQVNPTVTTTYILTVTGAQGQSNQCQTAITVSGSGTGIAPSCWITLTPQYGYSGYSQPSTLSWGSTNATSASISPSVGSVGTSGSQTVYPSGSQVYTMTVYNAQGQSASCQTSQYYQPGALSCTISANPSTIQNGQTSYLTWNSMGNVTSAWLSDGLGSVASNGSLAVRPNRSTNYTLTVSGPSGASTCNAYVNVAGSYVSLTQIPYTGFDFGPMGNALYFAALIAFALAAGYLVVYYFPAQTFLKLNFNSRRLSAARTRQADARIIQEPP